VKRAAYYAGVAASAMLSAVLGSVASAALTAAPTGRQILSFLILVTLIAGLLMNILCKNPKLQEIGRMLLFASILALLLALAPLTVRFLPHWP
jgi:hypothetical protein